MRIENVSFSSGSWAFFLKKAAYGALFFVIATAAFSNSLFQISSVIFIVLSLLSVIGTRQASFLKNRWAILVAVYFLMNLISLAQSAYLFTSLKSIFAVLRQILLCLSVIYTVDSKDKFKALFQFFCVVAFMIALDALIQGMVGYDLIRGRKMTPYFLERAGRLTGPFHHANDFSAYLSFVIFLFLGLLPEGLKLLPAKRYWILVAGFLAVLAALAGTYSRGAWTAVGVTTVLFILYKRNVWLIAGLLLVLAWAGFFSPELIRARVWSITDIRHNSTFEERKELWKESLRMIRKSPYFGSGVNTYAKNEPLYKSEPPFDKTKGPMVDNQYAHNGYLQIAAEIGCLGLLSFLVVMGYSLASAFYSFTRAGDLWVKTAGVALVFGIFSFLIHSAVETNLQSVLLVNTLWLAVGMMWAANRLTQEA